jgi:crotonobetainyl-CoA:carnitine CoA-transferase CaiB-like acyl-CoA transferase
MTTEAAGALAGFRVLEIADESGAYCGKLLADLGADVIKVEPPDGDRTRAFPPFIDDLPGENRSFFFQYMNTSKRSLVLDLDDPVACDRLRELSAGVDLVIETLPPGAMAARGLAWSRLREANPGLVMTSITGFGQTGPRREFRSSDLVSAALGGVMAVTGEPDDPPVTLAGEQCHITTSTCAAASSLIALHHSRRTGSGQHVDISALEATTSVTHICGVGKWLDDGIVPLRGGTGLFASVPSGAYPCSDGLVYLMVNRPLHWQALAEWIHEATGNREVLDPMFRGPSSSRLPYRELLDLFISELTGRFSVDEIYREGQRRHIAMTPVNAAAAVTADRHLRARSYFVEVANGDGTRLRYPGAPYRHVRTPWRIARTAPRIGEHDDEVFAGARATAPPVRGVADAAAVESAGARSGALSDLRVVEFTAGMAGPWIGRYMAWCGADVIKVESQQRPSVVRLYVPPGAPELGTQPELSPWFTDWDAGKRFVALDLERPEAVDLAKRLVAHADIVVENFSAGVMDKLGLGYEALRAVKPDLIYFSTSGYGDSGPDRSFVTWGPNIEALSGLSTLSGFPERDCTITQYAYPDGLSALHGLVAVTAAVLHRARSGEGQAINLSQFETTVAAIGPAMMAALASGREPCKLANGSLRCAPHGCYRCAGDDRWCVIAVADDSEWAALCNALDSPEWLADERFSTMAARLDHAAALHAAIEASTREHSPEAVMERLQAAGVAAAVVQTVEDQYSADPQLAARGFFEEVEHRKKGAVVATGIPLGLTGTPGRTGLAGSAIGEDNEAVFRELVGLDPAEYQRFVDAGAIEVPPESNYRAASKPSPSPRRSSE